MGYFVDYGHVESYQPLPKESKQVEAIRNFIKNIDISLNRGGVINYIKEKKGV